MEEILDSFSAQEGAVIPILQRAQQAYGYLPEEALRMISKRTGFSLAQLYGVATFYSQFYLQRRGRHVINICDGTACHVKGAPRLVTTLEEELGIKAGETSPDYRVTLEVVYCLGSCALAPMAVIDGQVYGRLVPEKVLKLVRELD
ncbi:MAG: NADH-quinone oxidoreductase subunit NuoE [Chloroflexi bacterium]|nr:NADH-quinone oxidoreductase subunit NuoE [Chloroflexota bacterium]